MRELLLKLAALFSYCGGPLYVGGVLKLHIDPMAGFLLTFLPVALMVLGACSLDGLLEDRLAAWAVWAGRQGLYVTLAMHAGAIVRFLGGVRVADQGLHYFGIAVGLVWTVFYLPAARRWTASRGLADDRTSSRPIEPS